MSSSTSGSKDLAKILVMVVLAVLACELAVRSLAGRLSLNIRHIHSIPAMATALAGSERPRILFLGASPIRHGIDLDVWREELDLLGIEPGTSREAVPDASWVGEWYYVFLNQFVRREVLPDLVVVGFTSTFQVADHKLSAPRIGALFADLGNIPELFSQDLLGLGERASFFVGHYLWTYGLRDTLQRRIGDLLIPGYREGVRQVEEWTKTSASNKGSGVAGRPSLNRYNTLGRFVRLFRDARTRLLMVVLPTPSMQTIDTEVESTITSAGAIFIDGRHVQGLRENDYMDFIHLNEQGAMKFSRWLAREAVRHIPRDLEPEP